MLIQKSTGCEKFTVYDLSSLREELQQHGLDSFQAGELVGAFLRGRGYGVSEIEARRIAGITSLAKIQQELEKIALLN